MKPALLLGLPYEIICTRVQTPELGEIQPCGWLAQQLQVQAEGLSGNLDTFWPDVSESQWIGGHSESWERVPILA